MIIVRLDEVHARGCGCEQSFAMQIDAACVGLRALIAASAEEADEAVLLVQAVKAQ